MHGVRVTVHIKGCELKPIPGLEHRFQVASKAPLLAAVLPYLRERRMADIRLAQDAARSVQPRL